MSGAKKKLERRTNQAQMGMTEREKQALKEEQSKRRSHLLAIVAGVVAVVLVIALLVWNSGVFDRMTTAVKFQHVDEAGSPVSVSTDELKLTRADMEYYYHMALINAYNQEQQTAQLYEQYGLGEYTPAFDIQGNLKKQYRDAEQTQSYHDYFMEQALTNAQQIVALYNAAKAEGYVLSEDAQTTLDSALSELDEQVSTSGYGSRDALLRANYGQSVTEKVYLKNLERYVTASDYQSHCTEELGDFTAEELEAYYQANPDQLDSYDYDYAYFDGTVQPTTDAEGNSVEPTEEEKANALSAAKQSADAMAAAVKDGTAVDEEGQVKTFATLAQDNGTTASTQQAVAGSNFATSVYAEWLMDEARVDGDVEVAEVEGAGYYVVQFHSRERSNAPASADVRHILISTEEREAAEAQAEAERIMGEFTSGEQTAERFGELAEQYSEDGRDEEGKLSAPGGLYEDVTTTSSYVPEFLDWIFTEGRQAGDVGIVQTEYGYHIMYQDSQAKPQWETNAQSALLSEKQEDFFTALFDQYPIDVNKWTKAAANASAEASAEVSAEASAEA